MDFHLTLLLLHVSFHHKKKICICNFKISISIESSKFNFQISTGNSAPARRRNGIIYDFRRPAEDETWNRLRFHRDGRLGRCAGFIETDVLQGELSSCQPFVNTTQRQQQRRTKFWLRKGKVGKTFFHSISAPFHPLSHSDITWFTSQ